MLALIVVTATIIVWAGGAVFGWYLRSYVISRETARRWKGLV